MKNIFLFIVLISVALFSCSPAKLVPESEKWYHSTSVEVDGKLESTTEANLSLLVQQKPNKKSLFWRSFRLDWYNLLGGDEHKITGNWVSRNYYRSKNWMAKTIGNPPTIYNPLYNKKSVEMMSNFLKSKGYYFSEVKDSVAVDTIWLFNDPKVEVIYKIKPGKPYIIHNIKYDFEDQKILHFVLNDSANRSFKKGNLFDASLLQKERTRITDSLKNHGYYKFVKEYIYYSVDKVAENQILVQGKDTATYDLIDITMKLKPYVERIKGRNVVFNYHPIFRIKDIYIAPNYDAQKALRQGNNYFEKLDTIQQDYILYLNDGRPNIKYSTIERGLAFQKDQVYNASKIKKSTQYLNKLSAVKLANTFFTEIEQKFYEDTINEVRFRYLNPHIKVSQATRQSYSVDVEGTYASKEYYAINGSLNYQHKNLFKGSEHLRLTFSTSWANNPIVNEEVPTGINFNTVKYGVDAKLTVPKFFIPAGFKLFSKKYTPQTVFGLGYSFEKRPDFNNQNMQASIGYKWTTSAKHSHFFSPLSLIATEILTIGDSIKNVLNEKNLLANFSDKIIPAMNYTFIYSGKPEHAFDNYIYFHTKLETAGNLLVAYAEATNPKEIAEGETNNALFEKQANEYFNNGQTKMYTLLDLPIAQYVQAEIDWRYYMVFHPERKLVFRIFAGAGLPYGNFPVLPSHKQYLAGGMNSLRGWSPGYVGPGTASYLRMKDDFEELRNAGLDTTSIFQQRGEMKLEANIEYRLQASEMLEVALFFDIGNTWALTQYNSTDELAETINTFIDSGNLTTNTNKIETQISPNFYKQLAYNTGIGFRFDFSFFILRLDLGAKINDPGNPDIGILKSSGFFKLQNWRLNFGIGHPF